MAKRTLKGRVTSDKTVEKIAPDDVVLIEIKDTDVRPMEARPITVAHVRLQDVKEFPFEFSIDFDDSIINSKPKTIFALSVQVRDSNGQVKYENQPELDVRDLNGNIHHHVNIVLQRA